METKKTIIVSVITTLATMFVVAVLIHLCCGYCGGKSLCPKQPAHCEKSMSCKSESKCGKEKSMCKKEEGCSKSSSCEKGKNTMEWIYEEGDKVIKKEVKVEVIDKK